MTTVNYSTILTENNNSNIRLLANRITFQNWGTKAIIPTDGLDTNMRAVSNVTVMSIVGSNVGIGTTAPTSSLDIFGDLNISGSITRNGAPLATTNWQQTGTTTFLSSGQQLGIGTTNTQGNDLWIAGTLSASNVYARDAFFIANDNQAVRNALQLTPCKSNVVVNVAQQNTFYFMQEGIFRAHASNADVFVNGLKLVYKSPTQKDYDLVTEWMGTSNTRYVINLVHPALYGDVVDVNVWPMFYDNTSSMRAGYVYQTFSTFQWQNQGPGNVYLLGNVGIGTTIALAPLHVMGNVNVNGNVVFSNGTLEDVALRNVNAAVGTFGDVSTVPRLTVDAKGRVTNIVNTSISLPVSSQFTTSGTNVYIIGSNVGINTATPRTILEVNGIIDLGDTLDNCKFCLWRGGTPSITDTAYYGFGVNGNMLRYHVDGNTSRHEFFAGSSPLMTIKGDGNVGIGSTNPQFKLDVTGTIRATGDIIAFSDARLKENLVKIENAMDRIRQLTGYTYNMKDDTRTRRVGLIAQDVERVLPEAVMKDSSYLSIAYGNLAALFVEGMKELHDEIVALKSGRKIFCSGSE